MKISEISEGFADLFKKQKESGPKLMNYADVEMIQSVDRKAKSNTKEIYNLQSHYGQFRFVYLKYSNLYEFRIIFHNNKSKSIKFNTASQLHKIFQTAIQLIQNKNGT